MKTFRFNCGCSFPVLDDSGSFPLLDFDIEKAPQNCPAVWDLFARGMTKGVFQLESNLGKSWCKRLRPENIDHIAALNALLRPGCLEALDENGISITEHYVKRKKGEEEVKPLHPALAKVLEPTFQVVVYQEQSMAICQILAGFSLNDADEFRKAAGKKLPEQMAKVEKKFIKQAEELGIVSKKEAEQIFEILKSSQRYSFNASHAYAYAYTAYDTAYLKAHFPLAFYYSWLDCASDDAQALEEIAALIDDSRLLDIEVKLPSVLDLSPSFSCDRKIIRFGLANIKGIGEASVCKLIEKVKSTEKELGKGFAEWTWQEFLQRFSRKIPFGLLEKLIRAGALDYFKRSRQEMLHEVEIWVELKDNTEAAWFADKEVFPSLLEALKAVARPRKQGGGVATEKRLSFLHSRISLLENPPAALTDSPLWVLANEEELLGVPLTYHRVDTCDSSAVTCSCRDYLAGKMPPYVLAAELRQVKMMKTKRGDNPGQEMAFLSLADASGSLDDVVCFPDAYAQYKDLLQEGEVVIIHGEKGKNGNLIVKRVFSG
jgi:DNA polymerase-3 subunit alpha